MRYTPVRTPADLKALERSTENRSLDFKETVTPAEWWELAKDVAAFANHVGGTILVGASEKPDNTATIFGVTPDKVQDIERGYENAAKDKCKPRPIAVPERIPLASGKVVLAINVEPFPLGLVGAMFYATNKKGEPVACDAWRFPMRVGKHNVPLQPDQIAMFMEPRTRRIVTLLEAIPESSRGRVVLNYLPLATAVLHPLPIALLSVDVMQNAFSFSEARGGTERVHRIPFDDVEAIWESSDGGWQIRVNGYLDSGEQSDRYVSGPLRPPAHFIRVVNTG